ncbi:aldose epimerase [Cryobacterium sp. TMT1-2-1]|uniref:aldose 1-epimerase family protein n=1 Tax=Cryobacterium sp. TMT1-2-1 TaxID=1259232 RepID=UPI00106D84DC|nr:aldose 1-epimerase family protein [Cryobacterium sp. TMT1-2-1]TFD44791.1 aldose epimerase [Cryobacterium sp. TMT1-2-1]
MRAATGHQYELTAATPAGPARATVTEVAAGLRAYSVGGIDLVETFPSEAVPPKAAGIVLVPWPNRIRDGVWVHDGVQRELALTEPALRNASHGLLRFAPYRELDRTAGSVTLGATVFPQTGYPFQLDTEVTYTLAADGLEVTHVLRNVGQADAPVALGAHPYLKIGDVPTGDLVLRVAAGTHIDVDDRLNPVGETPVDGTPFDLRNGQTVRDLDLDDGFGSVAFTNGRTEHSLTAPDGRCVVLWGDENMRYVQVFTPRNFPVSAEGSEPVRGQAVAIEPMTAPANAFNSGAGLRALAPGESWTLRWGIRHEGFGG